MLKLIYKISVLFICVLIPSGNLSAQTYYGNDDEFYKDMHNNARSSALGRAGAALTGSPLYSRFNAAAAVFSNGINIEYSEIKPNNGVRVNNSNAERFGLSFNSGKYGALSFVYNHYEQAYYNDFGIYLESEKKLKPEISNYLLSYSFPVADNLGIGINVNYFMHDKKWGKRDVLLYDAGILNKFVISKTENNQNLFVGVSLSNITNREVVDKEYYTSSYTGKVYEMINYYGVYPSELRIGLLYEMESKQQIAGFNLFKYTLIGEYENPVNSALFTMYKLGLEFTFMEMLSLRIGLYDEKINDSINNNCNSGDTFGVGINIPVNRLLNINVPVSIKIDYANLSAPRYYDDTNRYFVLDAGLNITL